MKLHALRLRLGASRVRFGVLIVLVVLLSANTTGPWPASSAEPEVDRLSAQLSGGGATTATARSGYGVIISNLNNLDKVQDLQFNWVKVGVNWKDVESNKGAYNWGGVDDAVSRVLARALNLLIRVDDSPGWASGTSAFNAPPINNQDLADFMYALASRYRGRVKAYEIWNEPNLDVEWGGQYPSPAKYGSMLRALYPRVKQADPDAKVITGGLSNVGDGNLPRIYGDLAYIRDLYDPNIGNAKGYFDAIGSHPYGGPNPPEQDPWNPFPPTGTFFRRAWQHNEMARAHGNEDKEIWATEMGWLLDPAAEGRNCDFGPHFNRFKLDAITQANYTVGAFQFVQAHQSDPVDSTYRMSFMGPMFLMNLDMATDSWRTGCEVVQYYSLLSINGSPRPVYTALKNMAKPALEPATLSLNTTMVNLHVEPGSPTSVSRVIQLGNSGDGVLYFSASVSASDQSWLSVNPASGAVPANLTITADASGLSSRSYRVGSVTITTGGAPHNVVSVPVTLYYGPVARAYMPSVARSPGGGW